MRLLLCCARLMPMWYSHGSPGSPGPQFMVATHTKGNWWSQELMPVFLGCTETHRHTHRHRHTHTHRPTHTRQGGATKGLWLRSSLSSKDSAPAPKRRLK